MLKSAIDDAKLKDKTDKKEDKEFTIIKEDILPESGGYGTISKGYSISVSSSYTDYNKLFSYIGNFRAASSNSQFDSESRGQLNDSRELVSSDSVERGARHVRYFAQGNNIDTNSLVPIAGMNSSEWEQFKLWMKLDPVMYRFKISTA